MMQLANRLGDKPGWTSPRERESQHWSREAARLGHPQALSYVASFKKKGAVAETADSWRGAYLAERASWHLPLGIAWERTQAERVAALRLAPPSVDAQALVLRARALLADRGASGIRRHVPRAIELLEHAASLGDAEARFELSAMLARGLLAPRDLAQAWRYLVQAVRAGHAPALAIVGQGLGDAAAGPEAADEFSAQGFSWLPTEPVTAGPWLERAAVRWHVEASAVFARLLSDGIAGPRERGPRPAAASWSTCTAPRA